MASITHCVDGSVRKPGAIVRLTGRKDVSVYFSRYSESTDWKLAFIRL
jgi:hypothetical protein